MKILVTGGSGYIGSHACVELLNVGYEIVVYDNFSNSYIESINRVEKITSKKVSFIEGDIRNEISLEKAIIGCDAVIHFAANSLVGESMINPLKYYDNNMCGTKVLLEAMVAHNMNKIVFS